MDLKKATETLIVFADLDLLVERVLALVTAHNALRQDGFYLISDDDLVEIYRLLTEIHEVAIDGVDPELVAPTILQLRLKLSVLEVTISAHLNAPSPQYLH
ncbi:MAG: hypothetical protein MIN69_08325 [Methylorubrum extorquens]|jgi:hypothetical protein|uniref:Uncharacterized protein n=1 Tax=Methylorubrum extorquens (strain DSM 6343 / CIP 106787 / DM4) TaxID=661410 RepID=C7C948_METED|nr:hypothetical protein [Methylorubrum extorquens]CAX27355.1 protein of unknown function [Methylorubrum extorquens DM4]